MNSFTYTIYVLMHNVLYMYISLLGQFLFTIFMTNCQRVESMSSELFPPSPVLSLLSFFYRPWSYFLSQEFSSSLMSYFLPPELIFSFMSLFSPFWAYFLSLELSFPLPSLFSPSWAYFLPPELISPSGTHFLPTELVFSLGFFLPFKLTSLFWAILSP